MSEKTFIGWLLAECPAEVPEVIGKLLRHAPASFDDPKLGLVALAIRELRADGMPFSTDYVCPWLEAKGKLAQAGGRQAVSLLDADSVPAQVAEYEAGKCWEAYRTRRAKNELRKAADALEAKPGMAGSILETARVELDELTRPDKTSGPKLTLRKPSEILAMTFDESDRIVGDRLLAKGQSLVIAGAGGVGKSRLLLQMAFACTTGREWITFETRGQTSKWLILQAENSPRRQQADLQSLAGWIGEDGLTALDERLLIQTLESDVDGLVGVDSDEACDRIAWAIETTKPDVVCFDSLYNFGAGDLNKDEDMRATLGTLTRLARKGDAERAIVVLHHARTGKAGMASAIGFERANFGRNSKVLHAWTRAQLNVAAGTPDNSVLVLTCGKLSNGRPFTDFAVRLNPDSMIYEAAPDFDLEAWRGEVEGKRRNEPLITPERVGELCSRPMTKAELAKAIREECGCARQVSYTYIKRAENRRTIRFSRTSENYTAA